MLRPGCWLLILYETVCIVKCKASKPVSGFPDKRRADWSLFAPEPTPPRHLSPSDLSKQHLESGYEWLACPLAAWKVLTHDR